MKNVCYINLAPHVRLTKFRDSIIVLDLKQDKYFIANTKTSEVIKNILTSKWSYKNNKYFTMKSSINSNELSKFLNHMIISGWIKKGLYPNAIPLFKNNTGVGMRNIDWKLPLNKHKKPGLSLSVLYALCILISINLILRFRGFYALIRWIDNFAKKNKKFRRPASNIVNELINDLNKACLLYPTRTKCLEWSVALVVLALKKEFYLTLNIGVQNYPFLAHAWVQNDAEVIADSALLPKNLATILREPSRENNNVY